MGYNLDGYSYGLPLYRINLKRDILMVFIKIFIVIIQFILFKIGLCFVNNFMAY